MLATFGFSENIQKISKYHHLDSKLNGNGDSYSAQANTVWSRIFREYLRENKLLSKTILACLSGDQLGSINEKI